MKTLFNITAVMMINFTAVLSAYGQIANKTITLIVPFQAGGHVDGIGREIAPALGDALNQTVVVENIPGAGGTIAAQRLLDAAADGNTLMLASPSQLVLAGIVNRSVKYQSEDFKPIHMVGTSPHAIMLRSGLPVNDIDDLVQLAADAARKGEPLNYASVGVGTLSHLLGEELARRIGSPLVHVPYKGGAEAMRDLAGERIDILINVYTAQQIGLAADGRFKFLVALSSARQPLLPDVPSADEAAGPLQGFYADVWSGVFARKDVPDSVISSLNLAMSKALAQARIRKALLDHSAMNVAQPQPSPAEVAKEYAAGVEQFRNLAKAAGLVKG